MSLSLIRDQVQKTCRELGLSEHLALLDRAWTSEVGGFASQAHLVAMDRASLVIEVKSAPAMQELSLRRKELIRRLNNHFSFPWIQRISIRLGAYE